MIRYYLSLAVRSLASNVVLTVLMIGSVGAGIGTSMTVVTILRAVADDPIPEKSARLFAPQIDNWGPVGAGDQPAHSPASFAG